MKKQLAFVLGGGGARGALQVGALRALLEAGYRPDLITGTSIGAANGAFLAIHGFNHHSIRKLEEVWAKTVEQDLLPTNLWWQTMRAIFTKSKGVSQQQIIQFAIENGLSPELRFRDLTKIRFYPVAADLNSGSPVIFGMNLDESVLDGVLASMALPPWINPLEKEGKYLIDGGAVSNLPVEPALRLGATAIIALDLFDPNFEQTIPSHRVSDFLLKLNKTVENRQAELEIELARARGVPVHRISLIPEKPVPMWDFRYSLELIERGYQLAKAAIASIPPESQVSWWQRISQGIGLERVMEGWRKSNN